MVISLVYVQWSAVGFCIRAVCVVSKVEGHV